MNICRPESALAKSSLCDDDVDVVIMLTMGEAKEVRRILDTKSHKIDPKTPIKDVPVRHKLDQGLEMIGVKRPRR